MAKDEEFSLDSACRERRLDEGVLGEIDLQLQKHNPPPLPHRSFIPLPGGEGFDAANPRGTAPDWWYILSDD